MNHFFVTILLISMGLIPINDTWANEADEQKDQLNSVARLLGQSSVSKQVLNSENDAAIQHYKLAKSSYESAVKAYRNGQLGESKKLLHNAKNELFDAVVYANIKGADRAKEKSRMDYDSKRRSVVALVDALDRVSVDKGKAAQNKNVIANIHKSIGQADEFYFKGQYAIGVSVLNKALRIVEQEISEMKTGDTLIRTLSFESPADEYKYELERNDTHFMLLDMCLTESQKSAQEKEGALASKEIAVKIRSKAEKYAQKEKFGLAVKELEKSTMRIFSELKKSETFRSSELQ